MRSYGLAEDSIFYQEDNQSMKSIRLWLRLSPGLIEGLDEIAKKQCLSRQAVIRTLIHDAILKNRGIIVG